MAATDSYSMKNAVEDTPLLFRCNGRNQCRRGRGIPYISADNYSMIKYRKIRYLECNQEGVRILILRLPYLWRIREEVAYEDTMV